MKLQNVVTLVAEWSKLKDFALGGGYYRVERSDVDFSGRRQPAVIVAKCG